MATASTWATADVKIHALTAKPGDNVSYQVLPVGTKLISENITLIR